MNAVEKALRHIERLIKATGRVTKKRSMKSVKKPATQGRARQRSGKLVVSVSPRGSAGGAPPEKKPAQTRRRALKRDGVGHRPPRQREPFVPPVTQPDVSELAETFAPPPTPPEVEGPITPVYPVIAESFDAMGHVHPAPVRLSRPAWADAWERAHPSGTPPEAPKVAPAPAQAAGRGSCKAVCADTGRTCKLLAGHATPHGHERGAFTRVLPPGGVPLLRERLDAHATAQGAAAIEMVPGLSSTRQDVVTRARRKYEAKLKGQRRDGHGTLKASIEKHRKSAHAGDDTTTGLESIDRRTG